MPSLIHLDKLSSFVVIFQRLSHQAQQKELLKFQVSFLLLLFCLAFTRYFTTSLPNFEWGGQIKKQIMAVVQSFTVTSLLPFAILPTASLSYNPQMPFYSCPRKSKTISPLPQLKGSNRGKVMKNYRRHNNMPPHTEKETSREIVLLFLPADK